MAWVPTPATEGVKLIPLIPGPVKVPPTGLNTNCSGVEEIQYGLSTVRLTTGNGLTTIWSVALFVHPFSSVNVRKKIAFFYHKYHASRITISLLVSVIKFVKNNSA